MHYQAFLASLVVLCTLLFLFQWFRQIRHALHGGSRPLRTHVGLNWCLLVVALLAGGGLTLTDVQTEAAADQQAADASSVKARQSAVRHARAISNSRAEKSKAVVAKGNRQGQQPQNNQPIAGHHQFKLDQGGHAIVNFIVPAQTQLQVVDAGDGSVFQTFPAQPGAGSVSYTFTREGNYYLILTKGQQAKTVTVTITR